MMRPTAEAVRLANVLDARGLADLGRNRGASEHKRDCQCQETHGAGLASISDWLLASDLGPLAQRVSIPGRSAPHFSRRASTPSVGSLTCVCRRTSQCFRRYSRRNSGDGLVPVVVATMRNTLGACTTYCLARAAVAVAPTHGERTRRATALLAKYGAPTMLLSWGEYAAFLPQSCVDRAVRWARSGNRPSP